MIENIILLTGLAVSLPAAGSADMARRAEELKNCRWGMFVCWSFSTFSGKEWTPGVKDAAFFKATSVDTDQWARTAKEAGMGYILFLTKHHDGFCLWDTTTTERKVTKAPLGRDVLAELRKSCDKHGIKLALYFSEGEFKDNKDYHPGGYTPEMKKAQLKELLTQYGPIEYIWFDHAQGTGGVSHQETVAWCKSFQPGCFVGFNHGDQEGADIRLGEMGRPGPLQDQKAAGPHMKNAPGKSYLLAEFTYPILPSHKGGAVWFYSLPAHDNLCLAAEKLYGDYLGAVKYGNIFSVDVGPDYAGKLRAIDVTTLRKAGEMIRNPPPVPPSLSTGKPAMDYRAVFTAPPKKIPSDNSVDAPLLGNGDTLVALGGAPDKLQFYINKNDLWIMRSATGSQPMPLARLDVDLPAMQGAAYHVEQHLRDAITAGRFEKEGKTLSLEAGVAATENLLWINLSAEGGSIQGRAGLHLPGQGEAVTGDVQVVERRFEQDVIVPAGAACAMRVVGGGEAFTVEPGKPVLLVAAVCSRFDQPDFRGAAVRRASEIRPDTLDVVRAAHGAWWRQFWGKSFVEIPDKVLEQRYYLSHYVMASASRVYDFPPGLFGWITTDKPSWRGDYHLNYNHVAPFYGLYAANHMEQADPCHAPILANADQARELCRKKLGLEGIFQYVGIGPKGSLAFALELMQKSNSAYSCVPLAFRWYATYDLDYARLAYPFVRDTALFWENWLKFETNRYVIYKDAVHERSGEDVNSIVSLALVRMVMNLALDMSGELGVDAARHEKWAHVRDNLSAYPVCRVRDLPEKFWPKHLPRTDDILNLPIFRYTEKGTEWWADNTLGIQHIYPAGGIGLDSSPELLERARNQIRVMNRWVDFNGMNSFYAAAARVGYDPAVILKEMRSMIDSIGGPNGMIPNNPHGMEHQSIVPNAIQEMLLQSYDPSTGSGQGGIIRFFPVWPKDQDARFGTLRARGAFLVSAELKGGVVCNVKIVSEKGRACNVQNPWSGKTVRVIRNGKPAESVSGDRFVLKTGVGETIEIAP